MKALNQNPFKLSLLYSYLIYYKPISKNMFNLFLISRCNSNSNKLLIKTFCFLYINKLKLYCRI